jgi:hypothetical protein
MRDNVGIIVTIVIIMCSLLILLTIAMHPKATQRVSKLGPSPCREVIHADAMGDMPEGVGYRCADGILYLRAVE